MVKKFSLILILFLILAGAALADKMTNTDGTIILYNVINSGGGTLTGGAYTLMDSKGDAIGSIMTNGNYTFIPGLFGLFGATGEVVGPPITAPDNGLIQNTTISIESGAIVIRWTYNDQKWPQQIPKQVDIWRLDGTDQEFNTSSWGALNKKAIALTGTSWIDGPGQGNPNPVLPQDIRNAYYRVVPNNIPANVLFGIESISQLPYNNRTVGKVAIALKAADVKLLSLPIFNVSMKAMLAAQAFDGTIKFNPQSGTGVGSYIFDGSALAGDFSLRPGSGYWLQDVNNTKTLSFVGSFETSGQRPIDLIDLTGNPVPYKFTSATLGGLDNDKLNPQSGTGVGSFIKDAATHQWPPFDIKLGDGFWYQTGTAQKWKIDLINGAKIQ